MRITFTGDLMCELPYYRQYKKHAINFDEFYKDVKSLWKTSDYVVANLETPLAGSEVGFTTSPFIFNTPDEFALAAYKAGVNVMTTANNHCMDKGPEGLKRTLDVLDKINVLHTGTYRNKDEHDNILVVTQGRHRVAIISCTYGTNPNQNGYYLSDDNDYLVDIVDHEIFKEDHVSKIVQIKRFLQDIIPIDTQINIKRGLGLSWGLPTKDRETYHAMGESYLDRICEKVKKAKMVADMVCVCLHSGGQFCSDPGGYTIYICKKLVEAGANIIIGNHPHVVQRMDYFRNVPVFYSLGNFCYSPDSSYIIHDLHPECSLLIHVDIDETISISYDILSVQKDQEKGLKSIVVGNSFGSFGTSLEKFINNRVGM